MKHTPHGFLRPKPLSALLALALLTGLATYSIIPHTLAQSADSRQIEAKDREKQSPASKESLKHALALSNAFKDVAKAVAPSVVNIRSTQKFEQTTFDHSPDNGVFPDDQLGNELRRFFQGQTPDSPREFRSGPQRRQAPRRVGEGTGVIARADGYIITNNHVVDGATEIRVKLDDEREYPATVVGADRETDLAVVKIDADSLVAAKFGDSSTMEVGEWVLAMGSPFGLQHTVTAGIVSAKGRADIGLTTFEDFIQTDAAINPGNSGGPLVNLYGEVIGINSAISTATGTYSGVGLSIPSNIVKPVLYSIIEHGKVDRGALGVGIQPLSKAEAEYYGFDGTDGVLIADVYASSAADKAGIKVGDIVTKINGKPTKDRRVLLNSVADHRPGDTISVEAFRNGKTRTFEVTLASRSQFQPVSNGQLRGRPNSETPRQTSDDLGLSVQPLTPELSRQFKIEDRTGVIVNRVTTDGPAAEQGIEAGDLIMRVGETPITGVQDYNQALKAADLNKGVGLQIFRDEGTRIVVLKIDDKAKSADKD